MIRIVRQLPCKNCNGSLISLYPRIFNRNLTNKAKYDDAKILAKDVNFKDFKTKRNTKLWSSLQEEKSDVSKEITLKRVQNLQYAGVALVALLSIALGTTYYVYDKNEKLSKLNVEKQWENISSNVSTKKSKKSNKKKLRNSKIKPLVPLDQLDSSVPGLYYWGDATNDTEWAAIPKRITQFDNMILRDVCLVNNKINLVIDHIGNLFNWDQTDNKVTQILSNQKLKSIKESNDCGYALNENGEILIIPFNNISDLSIFIESRKRISILPKIRRINQYNTYNLKLKTEDIFDKRLDEKKIVDFDTGSNHLVLISDVGKAYSCSTAFQDDTVGYKSRGQFGVPSLSPFNDYPKPCQLYEIELLNKSLAQKNSRTDKENNIEFRKIVKVACGDYHTIALDSNGSIFSFGWNRFGQLGFNISYENEILPYPKQISMYGFVPFFNETLEQSNEDEDHEDTLQTMRYTRSQDPRFDLKCIDIACSKETSYMSVQNALGDTKYFAIGNGSNGELGNGTFKNSQFKPTRVKLDESKKSWVCNKDARHVICMSEKGNVESWGLNDKGQVGNWQKGKYKFNKPEYLPLLIEPGIQYKEDENAIDLQKLQIDMEKQKISIGKESSCIYWLCK